LLSGTEEVIFDDFHFKRVMPELQRYPLNSFIGSKEKITRIEENKNKNELKKIRTRMN